MADTIVLLRFDEPKTYQLPADEAGNLQQLQWNANDPALDLPTVADGVLGRARLFSLDDEKAFYARGVAGREGRLALRRSTTVEAICHYVGVEGTVQTLVSHGTNASAAERTTWLVQIERSGGADYLRMRWIRSAGSAEAALPSLEVEIPEGGWIYLACVREWISTTEVNVSWYINGAFLATVTTADGDIEGGHDGETSVGVWFDGNGVFDYIDYWQNEIDQIRISEGVRTAEEIEATYRRMFIYPGNSYALLRAMLPLGQQGGPYSNDPESVVQRELAIQGAALGYAWSRARDLQDDCLPDRAWEQLPRWEKILGLAPRPGDQISKRRIRVGAFERRSHGYARDQLKESLSEILNLDAALLQIIESSNYRNQDDFTGADPPTYFDREDGTAGAGGSSVVSTELQLALGPGHVYGWGVGENLELGALPLRLSTAMPEWDRAQIQGRFDAVLTENDMQGGLCVYNLVTGDFLQYGIRRQGGTVRRFYRTRISGMLTSSVLAATSSEPITLRIRDLGDGTVDLQASDEAEFFPDVWTTDFAAVAFAAAVDWCGLFMSSDVAVVSDQEMLISQWRIWTPQSRHMGDWFLLRDATLGAPTYDRDGAQLALKKQQPADLKGHVVEEIPSVCDSPFSRVDGAPCS